jgi:hypothetical protein
MAALYILSAHGASQLMRFEGVIRWKSLCGCIRLGRVCLTFIDQESKNLALRWRGDGNEPTVTSITLMAAHPDLYW